MRKLYQMPLANLLAIAEEDVVRTSGEPENDLDVGSLFPTEG